MPVEVDLGKGLIDQVAVRWGGSSHLEGVRQRSGRVSVYGDSIADRQRR